MVDSALCRHIFSVRWTEALEAADSDTLVNLVGVAKADFEVLIDVLTTKYVRLLLPSHLPLTVPERPVRRRRADFRRVYRDLEHHLIMAP